MITPSFQTIKAELLQLDAGLQDLTDDQMQNAPDRIHAAYLDRMDRMVSAPVADALVERLMADADLRPAIVRSARLRRQNMLRLEVQFAQSVMASPDPWAHLQGYVYYRNYQILARMECEGGGLHAGDRVVFLGSGPLPLTLICLSREHGIEGVGIEQDTGHAGLSERAVHKLGLDHAIQIVCGNHFKLPLGGPCRLVMIGADAMPKGEIFAHLARSLEPGQMISYRIYERGLRRLFDAPSCLALPPEFREIARIQPEPPVNNTCVFAVR